MWGFCISDGVWDFSLVFFRLKWVHYGKLSTAEPKSMQRRELALHCGVGEVTTYGEGVGEGLVDDNGVEIEILARGFLSL